MFSTVFYISYFKLTCCFTLKPYNINFRANAVMSHLFKEPNQILSILLQYQGILSSKQKHTICTIHKKVCTNGFIRSTFPRSL